MKALKTLFLLVAAISIVSSCEFSTSSSISFKDGITTRGKNLKCDDVFVSIGGNRTSRKNFIYGETVEIHFNKIEGFKRINKEVKPGIEITVISSKGKKVIHQEDLYEKYDGKITDDPLDLYTAINMGRPIEDNERYTVKLHLWDKKGKGTFDAEFEFTVSANKKIKTQTKTLSYDKIYLYDQNGDSAITANNILPGQTTHIIIEGLQGFATQDGKNKIGLSLEAKDKFGYLIFKEDDLFGDDLVDSEAVSAMVTASFGIDGGKLTNPVMVKMRIFDKLSNAELNSTMEIKVQR